MNKENLATQIIEFIQNPSNRIINLIKNVDDDRLYYSKAIRTICVIDENFDRDIDDCIGVFNADSFGEYFFTEEFETEYGKVLITQNEDFDTIVTFSAEDEHGKA